MTVMSVTGTMQNQCGGREGRERRERIETNECVRTTKTKKGNLYQKQKGRGWN